MTEIENQQESEIRQCCMKEYHFHTDIARKYGVDEAIILYNIEFWIKTNRADKKHFHDGRTWHFNSIKAFCKIWPFWKPKHIRRKINGLITAGVLVKGNYNKSGYDRTTWYAFKDEKSWFSGREAISQKGKMDVPKKENPLPKSSKPIPDNNPCRNQDKKGSFLKTDLSSKESRQQYAMTLLLSRGVNEKVAKSIVCEQHTPLSSIEEVIKNGLAKEQDSQQTGDRFKLGPGYIVKALNQARNEGKVVGPTRLSKQLSANIKSSKEPYKPLSKTVFEKRKKHQLAALQASG